MMVEMIHIFSKDDLELVADYIHDNYFCLDDIRADPQTATLDIPFKREFFDKRKLVKGGLTKVIEVPVYSCLMRIGNVVDFIIKDTEQIGTYDFSHLDFDTDKSMLRVVTNVPITIDIVVDGIDIALFREEVAADSKQIRTFLG